jgi:hypothetical protein
MPAASASSFGAAIADGLDQLVRSLGLESGCEDKVPGEAPKPHLTEARQDAHALLHRQRWPFSPRDLLRGGLAALALCSTPPSPTPSLRLARHGSGFQECSVKSGSADSEKTSRFSQALSGCSEQQRAFHVNIYAGASNLDTAPSSSVESRTGALY